MREGGKETVKPKLSLYPGSPHYTPDTLLPQMAEKKTKNTGETVKKKMVFFSKEKAVMYEKITLGESGKGISLHY